MSEMSVCLSVRPSVKRVNCDKAKEICARIPITPVSYTHLTLPTNREV